MQQNSARSIRSLISMASMRHILTFPISSFRWSGNNCTCWNNYWNHCCGWNPCRNNYCSCKEDVRQVLVSKLLIRLSRQAGSQESLGEFLRFLFRQNNLFFCYTVSQTDSARAAYVVWGLPALKVLQRPFQIVCTCCCNIRGLGLGLLLCTEVKFTSNSLDYRTMFQK